MTLKHGHGVTCPYSSGIFLLRAASSVHSLPRCSSSPLEKFKLSIKGCDERCERVSRASEEAVGSGSG
jgi:hypothetical protein